ncbi:hypothetical protein GCM10008090_14860 [Arenicella chitinivorans]|uniref:Carboxyltransferase domain-containing protein n=1 Tax=Arenicella chitinivorans TaxID=1329800 RepID=A0A918RQT9_9GAMM|nr:allophanate hydrolase subunit 1 [Arenicella chitinivorans]GHA06227.1 hypothetical protein GCM10008090_14860 [Arenicella chitinivorans]
MSSDVHIAPVSVDTWLLTWPLDQGALPDAHLVAVIGKLANNLRTHFGAAMVNTVPAYCSLMVQIDLRSIDWVHVEAAIRTWLAEFESTSQFAGRHHRISVCYDPDLGLDMHEFSALKQLTPDDVTAIHSQAIYTVFAVGFLPGFAYLGHVDERLSAPRRATFRATVPAGSVAIADRQTAIYPSASPGGWQIIGRAPQLPTPGDFSAGDTVEFVPIDRAHFDRLAGVSMV